VLVSGSPQRESVPGERNRHSVTVGARLAVPAQMGALRHLVLYGKYRFYRDDWGITAHAPELRTYMNFGAVEIRLTGRYYTQTAAEFFRWSPRLIAQYDLDSLDGNMNPAPAPAGVRFKNCMCFTGDSKLSPFSSFFVEARIGVPLRFLDHPKMPLGKLLGESTLALSYGHYVNSAFAHAQFGDAGVAGLEWIFPL